MKITRRSACALVAGLAVAGSLAVQPLVRDAQARDANPDTLKVALLPDENAGTVIRQNRPLQDYLQERLGKDIELVVTTDYSSMIEAMRFGRIDLAYFGPLSYILAKSKSDITPIVALVKGGGQFYHAVAIANVDSGIDSLEDIEGIDFAFGDPASTSSHLMPRYMLQQAGKVDGRDYTARHLGAHDAVAVAVQNGTAPAGGLSQAIFDRLLEQGAIDETKVKVIQVSQKIPQYPWTAREGLDPALVEQVRQAFLELDDPEVLEPFKADGFATIEDSDYDVLRDLAQILNVNLGS
ncbi:phosphate ABC transporter substrate-binding protein [Leptolyngbya valderiana BDU 20041]|nr:phosphate ABC transporter substrate-binding protein [Leptolyngbya valderiana BDU 20041]